MKTNIERERKRLIKMQEFWQSYFYKPFFGTFNQTLRRSAVLLADAEKQLELKDSVSFKEAVRMHGEAKDGIESAEERTGADALDPVLVGRY